MRGRSLHHNRLPFTDEELKRYQERYMWDARHTSDEPESEGYGYDNIQMFRDLEQAEQNAEDEHHVVTQLKRILDESRDEARLLKEALNDCWACMDGDSYACVQIETQTLAIKVHNELDHQQT